MEDARYPVCSTRYCFGSPPLHLKALARDGYIDRGSIVVDRRFRSPKSFLSPSNSVASAFASACLSDPDRGELSRSGRRNARLFLQAEELSACGNDVLKAGDAVIVRAST